MTYLPIVVDTTPITDRLDAIEAAGPIVIAVLLEYLADKRAGIMYALKKNKGEGIGAEGNIIPWTPEIKTQVEAELARVNKWIEALS
jgi:hypothetical protein